MKIQLRNKGNAKNIFPVKQPNNFSLENNYCKSLSQERKKINNNQDFWDDTKNEENKSCSLERSPLHTAFFYSFDATSIRKLYKKDRKNHIKNQGTLYKKYKYLLDEFQDKPKSNNNSLLRCHQLYYESIEKAKVLNQIRTTKETNQIIHDQKVCTFSPKLNLDSKNLTQKSNAITDMYKKNVQWLLEKNENILKNKQKYMQEKASHYTHKPNIEHLNIGDIFNEDKNVINKPENFNFLLRQIVSRDNRQNQTNKIRLPYEHFLRNSHYSGRYCEKNLTNGYMKRFKESMHRKLKNLGEIKEY